MPNVTSFRSRRWLLIVAIVLVNAQLCKAQDFDFVLGPTSFADVVITYDCDFGGGRCPQPFWQTPENAIGKPEGVAGNIVSLGTGGLLEVGFVDNLLTNSGDDTPDLAIIRGGGPPLETVNIWVRPTEAAALLLDQSGFIDVGLGTGFGADPELGGGPVVDLDSHFQGFSPGSLAFDAVRIVDDSRLIETSFGNHGIDIRGIGAISSVFVPEPNGQGFLVVVLLFAVCRSRGKKCQVSHR